MGKYIQYLFDKISSLLPLSFFKKLLTIETNTQRMGDQYRFFCLNFCQGIFFKISFHVFGIQFHGWSHNALTDYVFYIK